MSPLAVSGIVFACTFGGCVSGTLLSRALPTHYMSSDSKDTVRIGMGLVATMAALVLGLLISSAKGFYDSQSDEVMQISARVILLDRLLAHYGPETGGVRAELRGLVADSIDRIWPKESTRGSKLGAPSTAAEAVLVQIEALMPKDDGKRAIQSQAASMAVSLAQTRWLMFEQGTSSVSGPMIAILVFWLAAIFISFGLFAPRNAAVIASMFVAALSVSGAIFLILEMYSPFGGLIGISSTPLRAALLQLGQ